MERRLSGSLLVVGFAAWVIGVGIVVYGTPFDVPGTTSGEPLEPILRPASAALGLNIYELGTIVTAAAILFTAGGLAVLTATLWHAGRRLLPALALVSFLASSIAWGPGISQGAVLGSAWIVSAASKIVTWGDSTSMTNGLLGMGSMVLFGLALARGDLVPPWVGWAAVVWSAFSLAALLVLQGYGPIVIYVVPLMFGVALLRRRGTA